jgi:hypothetical protein
MSEGIGNRGPVGLTKQQEQPIAQRSEYMCGCPLRGMSGIFPKGYIPHIMQPILNRPMPAPQRFNCSGPGLLRRHAHQSVGDLTGAFPCCEGDPFTYPPDHLLHIRPIDILNMGVATDQGARFQTTMPFFGSRPDRLPHLVIGWVRGQRKEQVQIVIQGGLVLFDDHQIVALLGPYLTCGRAQGVQGIKGHNFPVQVAPFEQRGERTTLIPFERDLDLAEHGCIPMLHQRDQMTRMAIPPNPRTALPSIASPCNGAGVGAGALGGWKAAKACSKAATSSRASARRMVAPLGSRETLGGRAANSSSRCSCTHRAIAWGVRWALAKAIAIRLNRVIQRC